jgi:hypothetical protein
MAKFDDSKVALIGLEPARLLAFEQGITSAMLMQAGGKWVLYLDGKRGGYLLKTARGGAREFSSIEAAARMVRDIGLAVMAVKVDDWNPAQGGL